MLSVERAVKSMTFANTLREQVGNPPADRPSTQTLDISEAKPGFPETKISDYRSAKLCRRRTRLAGGYAAPRTARRLSGGLTYGEIPAAAIKNMVVDTHGE